VNRVAKSETRPAAEPAAKAPPAKDAAPGARRSNDKDTISSPRVASADLIGKKTSGRLRPHARRRLDGATLAVTPAAVAKKLDALPLGTTAANKTRIFDTNSLEPKALKDVLASARRQGFSTARFGDSLIMGRGHSFHLTVDVLREAEHLDDPELKDSFTRILRVMTHTGLGLTEGYEKGVQAYYSHALNVLACTMPSRADLSTFCHEVTHARFDRLAQKISSWAEKKKLVVPFEIDGPPPVSGEEIFGGFFNLLNELNSYRVGNRFDGHTSDQEILAYLKENYGGQAGEQTVSEFCDVWPASSLGGRSVPRLLLDSVRTLNRLNPEQVQALGERALLSGRMIDQIDFLRLVNAHYARASAPAAVIDVVRGYVSGGADSWICEGAGKLLTRLTGEPPACLSPQAPASMNVTAATKPVVAREHVNGIGGGDVQDLLRRAFGRAISGSERSAAQKELSSALDELGFAPLGYGVTVRDGAFRVNRSPNCKHWLFSPATDQMLTAALFDPNFDRDALVGAIVARFYPEELPMLRARLLIAGTDERASELEKSVARSFLTPQGLDVETALPWGAEVSGAVLARATPDRKTEEYVAEYYRLIVARALGDGHDYASENGFDATARARAEADLFAMTPAARAAYDHAIADLWTLLTAPEQRVRTAARYALATHPVFVLGEKDKILAALAAEPGAVRTEIVHLLAMTKPGFLPEVDEFLTTRMVPAADEAQLLKIRDGLGA